MSCDFAASSSLSDEVTGIQQEWEDLGWNERERRLFDTEIVRFACSMRFVHEKSDMTLDFEFCLFRWVCIGVFGS